MATGTVANNLSIKNAKTAADPADLETKIEILLKLAVIPDIKILAPSVSVKNGTVTLGGIVDAFWKKSHIEKIIASEPVNVKQVVAFSQNGLLILPQNLLMVSDGYLRVHSRP